ncbi:LysR substrate-binding domain-containing protein [Pseudonocardia sp. ICBG1293]|uniref:LysR substrate-binding domain-containing protein n=1 Tax=Pseudonocardia sp. ICBG1293 TaxID=2844382 RepID=UPI001CCC72AD|nr:LysR substrate-binding domain-containing protein [Pseudonocardia sp. ICBG1293]
MAPTLNLHLTQYLAAVVDEGHFGRAAQRLHVSGSALSKQIRTLEDKLGVELVDRRTHPVGPTEAGRLFLTEAREALAAADRALAAVAAHRRAEAGVLRLGFMTATTGAHTRRILERMRREVPDVAVQLIHLPWSAQADAVHDRTVDACLVGPPILDTAGVRLDLVRNETLVVALPAGHHLADRSSVVLADLDEEVHITDDRADPQWVRWWAHDPRPSGRPVRYGASAHTVDEMLEVVASGVAVAVTGAYVGGSHRHPGIVFLPVVDAHPCPISLCTRADATAPAVEALRRAVDADRATSHPWATDPDGTTRLGTSPAVSRMR